jgi:hypothetical protein
MVCGDSDGWGQIGVSQGDGIEASLGEGMAAGETAEGQPGAFDDAEADEGDVSVFRARGKVEALSGAEGVEDRRQHGLVEPVNDADDGCGLGVWHCVRRHGVAQG